MFHKPSTYQNNKYVLSNMGYLNVFFIYLIFWDRHYLTVSPSWPCSYESLASNHRVPKNAGIFHLFQAYTTWRKISVNFIEKVTCVWICEYTCTCVLLSRPIAQSHWNACVYVSICVHVCYWTDSYVNYIGMCVNMWIYVYMYAIEQTYSSITYEFSHCIMFLMETLEKGQYIFLPFKDMHALFILWLKFSFCCR